MQMIWPVFPRFAPGAADRWRMPWYPAAGFWRAVTRLPENQYLAFRAQACAQAIRPDQSRRREARKNRPGNGNGLQRQTHIHAVRLFWALQRRAALGAAARGVVVTPPVLGS